MKVFINNNIIELHNNMLYDYYVFDLNMPTIIFNKKINTYYTYLIINTYMLHDNVNTYKYHLNLLIINNDKIISSYKKPNPQKYTGEHKYCILIYKQNYIINTDVNIINNFNLYNFVDSFHLILVDSFLFFSIHT